MKYFIRIIQVLVGVLFIISGLVKANDPLGLAYKMDEFFQLWNTSLASGHFFAKTGLISLFTFLNEHNLFLSITMITFEIVAGVALLLGWMKKFNLYLLLLLIIFFSFLTGYAYLSGKFTNCGCFGDCLPVTPLTSFLKDIFLLIAISFLIIGQRHLAVVSTGRMRTSCVLTSLVLSLFLQWFVLNYLPLVDCLPLKKGNNISEQIAPPKNAIPTVYETRLVYENTVTHQQKEMSQDEFNNSKIWQDSNWKWKATNTKLIKQGADIPKLHNFSLTTIEGTDVTQSILNNSNYLLLYCVDPSKNANTIDRNLIETVTGEGLQMLFVTTTSGSFPNDFKNNLLLCDGTVFRIAARVNPTIYLIKKGTIINKWPLKKKAAIIKAIRELKVKG